MATNVELYRRIMERMADDPEVVGMCRAYVDRAEAQTSQTQARFAQVRGLLASLGEDGLTTAAEAAASLTEEGPEEWTTRRAAWYLARLSKEGFAETIARKGEPNAYRLSTLG